MHTYQSQAPQASKRESLQRLGINADSQYFNLSDKYGGLVEESLQQSIHQNKIKVQLWS